MAVDELSTDMCTVDIVVIPDVFSYPINSAHTNAVASFALNLAAERRRAQPHWGHPRQLHAERQSLDEGTQGLTTRQHEPEGEAARYRDAFVSPRRRDQEMLANVALHHRRTLQEQERLRRGIGVPNASPNHRQHRELRRGQKPTLHLNYTVEG